MQYRHPEETAKIWHPTLGHQTSGRPSEIGSCSTQLLKVPLSYQPLNITLPDVELAVLGQVYGAVHCG